MQLLTTPLTPAVFALGEVRFSKQFSRLAPEDEERAVPIEEYVETAASRSAGTACRSSTPPTATGA